MGSWIGFNPGIDVLRMIFAAMANPPDHRRPIAWTTSWMIFEALRAELGLAKAHIAGHSLGGMIGPAYARRFPDQSDRSRCSALLLDALKTTVQRSRPCRSYASARHCSRSRNAQRPVVHPRFPPVDLSIAQRMQQAIDCNSEVFLSVFDVYADTEMAPWLAEIRAPALVLTGEFDGGCPPRLNEFIARTMPRAELVVLPGLRHAILLEAPDQIATSLMTFLAKH